MKEYIEQIQSAEAVADETVARAKDEAKAIAAAAQERADAIGAETAAAIKALRGKALAEAERAAADEFAASIAAANAEADGIVEDLKTRTPAVAAYLAELIRNGDR